MRKAGKQENGERRTTDLSGNGDRENRRRPTSVAESSGARHSGLASLSGEFLHFLRGSRCRSPSQSFLLSCFPAFLIRLSVEPPTCSRHDPEVAAVEAVDALVGALAVLDVALPGHEHRLGRDGE